MFSVNVDKIIRMTPKEADNYSKAADTIMAREDLSGKSLAIVGGGIPSFKLASSFMEKGKKVLFIDADLETEVFLGKYKLGKNLTGFTDYIRQTQEAESLICVTNREDLDIIFTGNIDGMQYSQVNRNNVKEMLDYYTSKYDLVIVQSDWNGNIAGICDATVVLVEQSEYSEISSEVKVSELDQAGCYVLGVIIHE